MQAVIPKMRQGGGGLIINISSMVTRQMRQSQRNPASATPAVDSAEHVAARILEAARREPDEQYMDYTATAG